MTISASGGRDGRSWSGSVDLERVDLGEGLGRRRRVGGSGLGQALGGAVRALRQGEGLHHDVLRRGGGGARRWKVLGEEVPERQLGGGHRGDGDAGLGRRGRRRRVVAHRRHRTRVERCPLGGGLGLLRRGAAAAGVVRLGRRLAGGCRRPQVLLQQGGDGGHVGPGLGRRRRRRAWPRWGDRCPPGPPPARGRRRRRPAPRCPAPRARPAGPGRPAPAPGATSVVLVAEAPRPPRPRLRPVPSWPAARPPSWTPPPSSGPTCPSARPVGWRPGDGRPGRHLIGRRAVEHLHPGAAFPAGAAFFAGAGLAGGRDGGRPPGPRPAAGAGVRRRR